jgi:hypothetical protein
MKKIFLITAALSASLLTGINTYAAVDTQPFPETGWISKSSTDPITIQNAQGLPIVIVIKVTGIGSTVPGINVKNCGSTTHVDPGSSAICTTNASANPVTISSDSSARPASGTYQIKQQ